MKLGFWVKLFLALGLVVGASIYFLTTLQPLALVAEAKRHIAVRSVPGTVKVVAEKEMLVRSDLAGRVVETFLEIGAEVSEGDLLMALDQGDLELDIERVQISLDTELAALERGSSRQFALINAQELLEDVERQYNSGAASKAQLDQATRGLQSLQQEVDGETDARNARVAKLENELKAMERQREKMSIRAPMDGVVTEILAHRGDLLASGDGVAQMISLERRVEVQVSEENFAGVRIGQIARVRFLGYGDQTFSGKVTKTLPVADPETQRYTVYLEMEMAQERLFPGLTGESTITLDERPGALIIPGSAIMGDRVFVVSHGEVSLRRIVKGYGSMTNVEIVEGLEEGDQVIVDDLELFKSGDRVRAELKDF